MKKISKKIFGTQGVMQGMLQGLVQGFMFALLISGSAVWADTQAVNLPPLMPDLMPVGPKAPEAPGALKPAESSAAIQTPPKSEAASSTDLEPLPPKPMPQITQQPIGAMLVLPIAPPGGERAFADVAVLLADEFANRMEQKAKQSRILNPTFALEALKTQGLGSTLARLNASYQRAGRPDIRLLQEIVQALSTPDQPVERVAFVEAMTDTLSGGRPRSVTDRFQALTNDALPKRMHYTINGRVKIYDTRQAALKPEKPEIPPNLDEKTAKAFDKAFTPNMNPYPLIWAFSKSQSIEADKAYNVTTSVFQDADSQAAFGKACRLMSLEWSLILPKKVYQYPSMQIDTQVAGQIVPK